LKSELSKLSNHLSDCIEFDSGVGRQGIGIQSLTNSSRSASTSSLNLKAGKMIFYEIISYLYAMVCS
jgi:hypothetical protein